MQCTWATKLKEELQLCEALALAKLKGSLDPDRVILSLALRHDLFKVAPLGKGSEGRQLPGLPAELADCILGRGDEPCGRLCRKPS